MLCVGRKGFGINDKDEGDNEDADEDEDEDADLAPIPALCGDQKSALRRSSHG